MESNTSMAPDGNKMPVFNAPKVVIQTGGSSPTKKRQVVIKNTFHQTIQLVIESRLTLF